MGKITGWTKVKESKKLIRYKSNKNKLAIIEDIGGFPFEKNVWGISVKDYDGISLISLSITGKQNAKNKIMKYMKSHPNG